MDVTPITADQEKARRDGCDCPDFVSMCAHFGGQFAQLMDTRAYEKSCSYWDGKSWQERGDWIVLVGSRDTGLVCLAMCPTVCGNRYGEIVHEGKQRDIAEAAFHAAEERLLRPD